jgi:acetyl-CoA/propionyl-CoA carboxylase biotin carboxyl carrier protein
MFRRVMIANRGEIALRIVRTLREMGITSIAAFSDADVDAPFVRQADEAYRLGPPPAAQSYLHVDSVLQAARAARVDAIHPGYGFLAENVEFAAAVAEAGFTFIGPTVESIRLMGDKVEARRAVNTLGVPVVPGTEGPVRSHSAALEFGEQAGYPIAVKAAGGGGGRGIRIVRGGHDMADALEGASRESQAYFKNPNVYLERYFEDPRHVEIQVLGDSQGTLVHVGERECSVQRRHQKLIEETPSPAVNRALRDRMGEAAILVAKSAGYTSAGTVEFLLTREGEFYFLEMNTRIQVEHPVTEAVSGTDLIREMVLIASGEPTSLNGSLLDPIGHAIEVRVNAEDPRNDFRPTPSRIDGYREPGGIGVRVDSGVGLGFTIPSEYDSLLSKVIAWAPNRDAARSRMLRALGEYDIAGPATTIAFGCAVIEHPVFAAGEAGTSFIARHAGELLSNLPLALSNGEPTIDAARSEPRIFEVEVNRKLFQVGVREVKRASPAGVSRSSRRQTQARASSDAVVSPMHGTVIGVRVAVGDRVELGQTLFVVEAMKMENEIGAHKSGLVKSMDVATGDTVEASQRLAVIESSVH